MSTENSGPPDGGHSFIIVGIGASAGGLEAISALFRELPVDTGMAFVLVQHLSPDFKSHMDQLLARDTAMPIHRVEDGQQVQPNAVYLIPPKKEMIIADGRLRLSDKDPGRGLTLPIDIFFRSLAADAGRRSVGVVLSGTGSDGSRGVQAVREAGGLVLCQSEDSAQFDGMPLNAQETGQVHIIGRPEYLARALCRYAGEGLTPEQLVAAESPEGETRGVEQLFKLLRGAYGIDFSHYKWSTISRRLERRLALHQLPDLNAYLERLTDQPGELSALYQDLLIGVTRFFRDGEAFTRLQAEVAELLLNRARPQAASVQLRVWVAGCATGEEAYSLAILLSEALEQAGRPVHFSVFATDVHRVSLEFASKGVYPAAALEELSEARKARYFRETRDGFRVSNELRQRIVFAPHNLINDAPFTRIDLVSCRNLLIYLKPLGQKKAFSLFHFSLKTGGLLFLGPSENPPAELKDEFETVNATWKIYRKRRDVRLPAELRLPLTPAAAPPAGAPVSARPAVGPEHSLQLLPVYDRLLESHMPPSLLVDEQFALVHSFGGAERFLKVRGGRLSTKLLDLVDDDLKTALTGALQHALKDQSAVRYGGLRLNTDSGRETLRLIVQPLSDPRTQVNYLLITFEPMATLPAGETAEADDVDLGVLSHEHTQALEAELRYTRENLQATIEELETANEELQATNEEMVASNEELQSTNEELHSVNEELYTVNNEYQKKIEQLTELTDDMDNLLVSTEVGVIFLDRELCIRKFTPQIGRAFHLLPQDIGRPLESFVHNLEFPDLLDAVRRVVDSGERLEREIRDRGGNHYLLRVLPYRGHGDGDGAVLTLIDIDSVKQTEQELQRSLERTKLALSAGRMGTWEWDIAADQVSWSDEVYSLFGMEPQAFVPSYRTFLDRVVAEDRGTVQAHITEALRSGVDYELECRIERPDGERRWIYTKGLVRRDERNEALGIVGICTDLTGRKRNELALAEARVQAESASQAKSEFLANMSHEIRTPMSAILGYADVLSGHLRDPDDLASVEVIRRNGKHLLEIINDILDLSKIEAGRLKSERQRFDPAELVSEVRSLMELRARDKGLALTVEFDGRLPATVDSDRRRLKQVLINLVGNAVKFTESGEVRLSARLLADAEQIEFVISDTGIGIDPEQQQRLFQPFEQGDGTTTREYEGSGLGLTISQRLAALLGGSIGVVSTPGEGSEFSVRVATGSLAGVPLVEPDPRPTPPVLAEPLPSLDCRVLVVDDRHDVRYLAKYYLEQAGARVDTAAHGQAALDMIAADPEACDVVVMDMQMPVLNGYDTTARLRADGFEQPVIALTAGAMSGDREKCLAAGCSDYLPKPVNGSRLVRAVARQVETGAASADTAAGGPVRVLVVDDSRDAARALAVLLGSRGFAVVVAHDGRAALQLAKQQQPAAVVLDINLPDINGREVARSLRADRRHAGAVLIALTGESLSDADGAQLFDHVLLKPADLQQLLTVLPRPVSSS